MAKQNRRNFRNILINPEAQIRYGMMFLAVSILVHAVTTVLVIQLYIAYRSEVIESSNLSMGFILSGMILLYLLLYGFSFLLGLLISHRLYGPLVNLERILVKLNRGEYSSRIVLRKYDDVKVKEIAELVNQLADKLEQTKR